jgi:hypothetical protein
MLKLMTLSSPDYLEPIARPKPYQSPPKCPFPTPEQYSRYWDTYNEGDPIREDLLDFYANPHEWKFTGPLPKSEDSPDMGTETVLKQNQVTLQDNVSIHEIADDEASDSDDSETHTCNSNLLNLPLTQHELSEIGKYADKCPLQITHVQQSRRPEIEIEFQPIDGPDKKAEPLATCTIDSDGSEECKCNLCLIRPKFTHEQKSDNDEQSDSHTLVMPSSGSDSESSHDSNYIKISRKDLNQRTYATFPTKPHENPALSIWQTNTNSGNETDESDHYRRKSIDLDELPIHKAADVIHVESELQAGNTVSDNQGALINTKVFYPERPDSQNGVDNRDYSKKPTYSIKWMPFDPVIHGYRPAHLPDGRYVAVDLAYLKCEQDSCTCSLHKIFEYQKFAIFVPTDHSKDPTIQFFTKDQDRETLV